MVRPSSTDRSLRLFFFSFVFLVCVASGQEPTAETSIRHVTVINVATGDELKDQTVKIQGERIVSIGATQEADASLPGGVDAHGGFLIPGLWDMHIHVHEVYELSLYVANGVTGVRIMSGDQDEAGYRAALARQTPSPEIYLASAIVDGSPPVWPGSIVVKKADDARRAVDDIKAAGADFINVYSRLSREAYFALADEAKKQHIDFEGHVRDAITAQEASAAGQRTMEHLLGIAVACSKDQKKFADAMNRAQFFRDRMEVEAEAYSDLDQAKCGALFAEFRSNDTWQVPTLSVLRVWGRLDDSKFTSDPRMAYIGKKSRQRWDERIAPQQRHWGMGEYQMALGIFAMDERVVGAMFHAGVPIMAGTDAMNPYCFPGFGLHDELAMLVESGLTPLAALQAATMNPAKFLGRSSDMGTVEAGKVASLVLLRADPLVDIHNTTQIEGVWLRGKYFDEAGLNGILDGANEDAWR